MNHDGTGLGLLISKALIEANGGRLTISSEGLNRGSTFGFTMKMKRVITPEENLSLEAEVNQIRPEFDEISFADNLFIDDSQRIEDSELVPLS